MPLGGYVLGAVRRGDAGGIVAGGGWRRAPEWALFRVPPPHAFSSLARPRCLTPWILLLPLEQPQQSQGGAEGSGRGFRGTRGRSSQLEVGNLCAGWFLT